jgi:hypothetical protein
MSTGPTSNIINYLSTQVVAIFFTFFQHLKLHQNPFSNSIKEPSQTPAKNPYLNGKVKKYTPNKPNPPSQHLKDSTL